MDIICPQRAYYRLYTDKADSFTMSYYMYLYNYNHLIKEAHI